ncbi:hypothetical protein D1007_06821 [Hordeum vulgare]|nr:hypothetical protein D1007_06821 [Hordeum vulgare]
MRDRQFVSTVQKAPLPPQFTAPARHFLLAAPSPVPSVYNKSSKWESTRALQREVAKQLKLSNWVMKMFDKQDEEDDFNGITDQGSRAEIADVAIEIQRSMQGRRFLVVLHNGGNEEIDISCLVGPSASFRLPALKPKAPI